MRSVLAQDEPAIPEATTDLTAAESTTETGEIKEITAHPERILAVLDMIRHGSITVDKGAVLAGISREKVIHLLNKLDIPFGQ